MTSRGRVWIGAGTCLLVATVGLLVGGLVWLPSTVRERVEDAARRRGLTATVAGVDAGFGTVVLRGVRLERDGALLVDIEELDTGADVVGLALDGAGAVRHVRVRGARVEVDLDGELAEALAALRGEGDGVSPTASGGRTLEIEGLAARLRDRRGILLRCEGGRARLGTGGAVQATVGPLELAPDERDGARIASISVRAERDEEGRWRLSGAELGEVAVRYRERPSTERSPLWARLRRHARSLGDLAALGEEGAEPSASAGSSPQSEAGETDATEDIAQVLARVGPRLAVGARMRLEGMSVVAHGGEDSQTVLRDLEAEVRVLGDARYRLEGSGRPGRGGRLGWRLTVEPRELRAEGSLDFQRLPFALVLPVLPALPWYRPEDTRLTGDLTIEGHGAARVQLRGSVRVEELGLSSPRIAPQPVRGIAFGASGTADWIPIDRRLEIAQVEVQSGGASVTMTGSLAWPEDHYLVDVRATLPPTPCDAAVGAIPPELLGELSAFSFDGRIGGRVVTRIDSRELEATAFSIDVANGCRFLTAPGLADVARFQGPFTHRVVEPDGTTFEMESGPGTASWTPIDQINPFLVQAVLGHEDGGFFGHGGFAPSAIRLALVRNLQAGRYVYGASTITMQLVKNVFLHREKTLARKVQEVLLTWWIESAMDKQRILELYLNVIEYGPGIYGIRNAAEHYFGRPPAELGPAESAYLATILPNPKAFHSHWEERALPDRHRRRVTRFLRTLNGRGRYDARALEYALAQIADFRFHHPGDPQPPPHESAGATRALPLDVVSLDEEWERALGPDDPNAASSDDELANDLDDPDEGA